MNTDRRDVLRGSLAAALATLFQFDARAQQPPARSSERAATPGDTLPVMSQLCQFMAGARSTQWPPEIADLAKQHILDTLAATVACHDLAPSAAARRYALAQSSGSTLGSTILGTRDRVSISDAVLANAITGHAAEINDFCPSAFVQPGPPIVSAALALAEQRKQSGATVLSAVIVGYELACRLPKALGNENLRRAGLANHGVGPVFGTAAAAACMLNLPEPRMADVLSYCAQQASGSWQWLLDIAHMEKAFVFAGMPARNGLQAALLVEAGFTGVASCLDADGGWLSAEAYRGARSDLNRAYLVEDLGKRFELPLVGYKRYPVGGPAQPGVHGVLELIKSVDRAQVESVTIAMPGRWEAFATAAMPALNLKYLTAIILLDGRLDFNSAQSLQRMASDEQARALMQRVEVLHDPSQERSPRVESARVSVTLRDKAKKEIFVDHVAGFPSHPLTRAQVEAKAIDLMTSKLGARGAQKVVDLVNSLEKQANVQELIDALVAK